jgi:hypothetical protein
MCHNCGTKAFKLSPLPPSLEGVKQRLLRDRRWNDRRGRKEDSRIFSQERRVGERRADGDSCGGDWVNADDLIIEIIEMAEDNEPSEATRISLAELYESSAPSPP